MTVSDCALLPLTLCAGVGRAVVPVGGAVEDMAATGSNEVEGEK